MKIRHRLLLLAALGLSSAAVAFGYGLGGEGARSLFSEQAADPAAHGLTGDARTSDALARHQQAADSPGSRAIAWVAAIWQRIVGTGHADTESRDLAATGTPKPLPRAWQAHANDATGYAANAGLILVNPPDWGMWGYGVLATDKSLSAYSNVGISISGYHLNVNWSDLKPTKAGGYDWSALDDKLDQLDDQGLRYTIMIQCGENTPQWVKDESGYFSIKNARADGTYPYYLSDVYQDEYYSMLSAVADHIKHYNSTRLHRLIAWQIAEGTTGDEGPYHGEMDKCWAGSVNNKPPVLMGSCDGYAISDEAWTDFRHEIWQTVYADVHPAGIRLMFNAGNDAEDLDYVIDEFPGSDYKSGTLSHTVSFDGEKTYFARESLFANSGEYEYRDRGELQNIEDYWYWQQSPTKMSFVMAGSALAGGLDMLNATTQAIDLVTDPRAWVFFNKYAEFRIAKTSNGAHRGFSALRDVIDFADMDRFPETALNGKKGYGPLVATSDQTRYQNAVDNVLDLYGETQPIFAADRLSALKAQYINQDRVDAIKADFPNAGWAQSDPDDPDTRDGLRHDFGIDMAGNYERFVTQIDPVGTTNPRWRVGVVYDKDGNITNYNDSQLYGRYAREFKLSGGKGTMYFKVDTGLSNLFDKNTAAITVTYYDEGNASWSILAYGAKLNITNGNTRKFISKTLTVPDFRFGGKLSNASDIQLQLNSGSNFAVVLVEFDNTAKKAHAAVQAPVFPGRKK